LVISRASIGGSRAVGVIPFDGARQLHRVTDPEVGDTLLVMTALGPARGVLRTQDFVEFRALASTHGIVVQPLADDVAVELPAHRTAMGRPRGCTLWGGSYPLEGGAHGARGELLDAHQGGADRQAGFGERQTQLMQAAAGAPEGKRKEARLDLARFYLGR